MAGLLQSEALNAREVASLLHIGRNAVYELAKSETLPSYKIGRKLLFSLADVEAYLESTRRAAAAPNAPAPPAAPDGSFVMAGHGLAVDLLAERTRILGHSTTRVQCGSYVGLVRLYSGFAHAALVHLYDQRTNSFNIPFVQRLAPGLPVIVFRLVQQWQGFAVAEGNPKGITAWGALVHKNVRLANREKGCSSRILLDEKIVAMGGAPNVVKGYESVYENGPAAASAVASGFADVAVIDEQTAVQVDGISFIPLQQEWLDLVVSKEGPGANLARTVRDCLEDGAFRREFARIVRGNADSLGAIVYES